MRKLIVFNNISLDGYFTDARGDMSWAHKNDAEWNSFTSENASGGGVFVFGRITYDLMASFWPTRQALEMMPEVAAGMNNQPKIVFSKSMNEAAWNNTRLIKENIAAEVRTLKNEPGENMVIMGSGTIVSQLTQERLIDEYQLVVHPIVLGKGRTLFEGVTDRLMLRQIKTRTFENGNVLVCYELT